MSNIEARLALFVLVLAAQNIMPIEAADQGSSGMQSINIGAAQDDTPRAKPLWKARVQGAGASLCTKGAHDSEIDARELQEYLIMTERKIKRNWYPPKCNPSAKAAVLKFRIHKRGEVSNLRILKSSGMAVADHAALKAIENAAPFHALPRGAKACEDFEFRFDFNVFRPGGSCLRLYSTMPLKNQ